MRLYKRQNRHMNSKNNHDYFLMHEDMEHKLQKYQKNFCLN